MGIDFVPLALRKQSLKFRPFVVSEKLHLQKNALLITQPANYVNTIYYVEHQLHDQYSL